MAEHESAADETGGWYDDAPITDEQIEGVRRSLDTPLAERGAAFAPFVVRKLLAEIDRLNTVLDANRVVRNAAESSSRTYKGAMELLKAQRTQLRAELADARGAMAILRAGGKEQCARAEKAEAERDEARVWLARVIGAVHHAYSVSELCEPEPGETMPTIASLWEAVEAIRDERADATGTALSATETEDDGPPVSVDAANSSANAAGLSEPGFDYGISPFCWAPNPHGPLHCGRLRDHEPPHRRGERTWTDETGTER